MFIGLFSFLLSLFALTVCLKFIWKKIGTLKGILLIAVIMLIDIDHFIFTENKGFMRIPENNQLIFQAFHTLEFLLIIILLNIPFYKKAFSLSTNLFPVRIHYEKIFRYYYLSTVRILLTGTLLHYLMDTIIYTLLEKWGYNYYSIIAYLFL